MSSETPRSIHVLHVDDQPEFGDLTTKFLERVDERLTVETATSAREGMDRLASEPYDCIVSDYEMPGQNGIEFLESVREAHPKLPFILFTGKGSEEVASEAISSGVSDYLQKKTSSEQYELLANRISTHVEQTRTQRELEERDSHLRQAQSVAHIGSWEVDIPADEIYWSDEVYEIFDIDDEELLIDHGQFLEFVHPEDREHIDAEWQAALEGDDYDVEHRIVTGNGETRWVREKAEITFDGNGTPINALGIVQDITTRKERDNQLRKTTARLDALFTESPDMINFHDAAGNIIKPNPRLSELTGYSESELTEMSVWDLDQTTEPERLKRIWADMDPGDSHRQEGKYQRRDGSLLPVEIHIRCIDQDGETRFVVISRDRRDREERKRELERQNERVETFVDALAHDIPNHLHSAGVALELLREEEDFEYADRVESAHRRVETLVDDLQTLVRAGTPAESQVWNELSTIARSCRDRCLAGDDHRRLEVVRDGRIWADHNRLEQLFENLFWNVRDHAGEDVTVRVGVIEDGFYVADDGTGIPEAKQTDVLSPRYTSAGGEHQGLGLAIVHEIANAHDWDVVVTDSADGGVRIECSGVETEAA